MRKIVYAVLILLFTGMGLWASETPSLFTPERDASFLKFVGEHIGKTEAQGGLQLYDPLLQKTWTLKFVKVLPETLQHKYTRRFQVAAQFTPKDGGTELIEVLFDSDWEDTDWDMEKVTLSKVNGELRKR